MYALFLQILFIHDMSWGLVEILIGITPKLIREIV